MDKILKILAIITIVQMSIMAIFLLSLKKKPGSSNKILAAFLFSNSIYLLYYILFFEYGYFSEFTIYFFRLGVPFRFLFGPLLFLYIRSFLTSVNFKKKDLIHFVPFILEIILIIVTFHLKSYQSKVNMLAYYDQGAWLSQEFLLILFGLFWIHVVCYMLVCLRYTKKYDSKIKNNFSFIDKIKLSWLRFIIYAFIFMWWIDFFSELIYTLFHYFQHIIIANYFSIGINLIFAIFLVFKALKYPNVLLGTEKLEGPEKYKKSGLNSELKETYFKQLQKSVNNNKPYLKFSLTLQELSEQAKIPQNYLSQIINEKLNKNFYDFINSYRIEEAKKLLSDPKNPQRPIIEIQFEAGFNSKSTFYTAFSKETNLTPHKYRKQHDLAQA